jgi:branched-chain amino acid transport system permease protein
VGAWLQEYWPYLVQYGINGLANGMIIALIALGYTIVYGIVELINFAHGDLFMLVCFAAVSVLSVCGLENAHGAGAWGAIALMLVIAPAFGAGLAWSADRLVYRPVRQAPKLTALVSAIGLSFVFVNLGLFWAGQTALGLTLMAAVAAYGASGIPAVVRRGVRARWAVAGGVLLCAALVVWLAPIPPGVFAPNLSAASPRNVANVLGDANLTSSDTIQIRTKDVLVFAVTLPLLLALTWLIKRTSLGRAMRAVAQHPTAARLMGIDVDQVIGRAFLLAGALAGVASVITVLVHGTVSFQMGFRAGMDSFAAAVLGGIGSLPGAVLGALLIGLTRSYTQAFLSDEWASVVVFSVLILLLIFRPAGLLGTAQREKV